MTEKMVKSTQIITEEAAEWFLDLDEHVLDQPFGQAEAKRREFITWLRRSPTHIEEFLQVAALHGQLCDLPAVDRQAIDDLVEEARSNVVSLDAVGEAAVRDLPPVRPRRRMIAMPQAIAASLVAFAALVGLLYWAWMPQSVIYETGLGEQRLVMLPDGSAVELNTQSRLELAYTDSVRQVRLHAGEAIFEVAKDTTRPFRVQVGDVSVDAIGTRFNIYRQTLQTVVTVVEGVVAIEKVDKPGSLRVERGAQVAISASGAMERQTQADLVKATAWRNRRLIFSNDSLATVVREVNRYNPRRLVIINARLAEKRISGTFKANQPETLVAFLQQIAGVDIVPSADGRDWQIK